MRALQLALALSRSPTPSRKVLKTSDYTDRYFVVLKALGIDRKKRGVWFRELVENCVVMVIRSGEILYKYG